MLALSTTVDVVVLAQASMARALAELSPDQLPVPVLSSPRTAVRQLRDPDIARTKENS
jgi:hypothetical protein